ncbi:MAG: FtsX-like permease family protein [Chloroflexi bacterium]|nr:FtsX-like permease family protein [Chloroflexota bacterium]
MLLVARKNLFSERIRLAISVGGVALSVFLIGILLSLYRGWDEKVGEYVEMVPADLWVAAEGTTDFIQAASALPEGVGTQLGFLPETDTVSPIIARPVGMVKAGDDPDDDFDVQLVGYDPAIGLGGPLAIVAGKSPPGPGEIVIDKVTSDRYGVEIGDRLFRGAESLTVVGKSSGGDFVFTQVGFVTLETAVEFLRLDPKTQRTFFLVTLNDPSEAEALAARLEASASGVVLFTGEEFADETRQRILGNILPMLIVVLIVAFVVGLSVAGLTIYTATVEKSREYGILKAEGFTNRYLYRVVIEQSLVTSAFGFILGAGLIILIAPFAQGLVPQFVVFVRWQDILGITGATLLMALIAAFIPVRRLAQIDPVTVFKG